MTTDNALIFPVGDMPCHPNDLEVSIEKLTEHLGDAAEAEALALFVQGCQAARRWRGFHLFDFLVEAEAAARQTGESTILNAPHGRIVLDQAFLRLRKKGLIRIEVEGPNRSFIGYPTPALVEQEGIAR